MMIFWPILWRKQGDQKRSERTQELVKLKRQGDVGWLKDFVTVKTSFPSESYQSTVLISLTKECKAISTSAKGCPAYS